MIETETSRGKRPVSSEVLVFAVRPRPTRPAGARGAGNAALAMTAGTGSGGGAPWISARRRPICKPRRRG
ncbi:transposase IS204/IS1001/IS1096/IS1165 family domain protein [Mycobacterium xenopi 3993]|nr:transposase IS204/IS1001/IS1096/IS1165 family domain protein [Mycobacterium xenopi 3993]